MAIRKESYEELRALSKRLNDKGTDINFRAVEQIGRYRQLAEENKQGAAIVDAVMEGAMVLLKQGRLCEALISYQPCLQRAPLDFNVQRSWRHLKHMVLEEMEKLAKVDPECAEFGRTYEKLLDEGYVSYILHLGAARFYLASGKVERAAELLVAYARLSPGGIGVAELALRLSELSENVEIQRLCIQLKEDV
jgi:tetratricopeptide (TPR) repeat protein